jgi:formate--tetrahydrofolate ligase
MTDIEIANSADLIPIVDIAEQIGVSPDQLELYGKYKAKLPLSLIDESKINKSKLILVTAISPTPAGEGKTTVSIGLSQGMNKVGLKTTVVLREPSLGPVFGIKGGAAGGGYSQVLPMEDINLHFTGDFSAIEKAHNLLAALIDNNIQSKSRSLNIDPRTVAWKRVMDMNDRSLRKIVVGLGGLGQGIPREAGFDITAASEIMAILCLSKDLEDLKERIGNIFVGFTFDKKPVYARDLNAQGAMTILLKDAIKPNLVQTIEGTPAIIHGGPFANIAQGTNTVVATKMGLSTAPYVVTEAGFGADLGAEKFLDIKCVDAGLAPDAVVIVATIKALKYHGGVSLAELKEPDPEAVTRGLPNLEKHIENIKSFGLPVLVTINQYTTDSDEEIRAVKDFCQSKGVRFEVCDVWGKGGDGATALAEELSELLEVEHAEFTPLYKRSDSPEVKIEKLCKNYYGADSVEYSAQAQKDLKRINDLGLNDLPICMAKTQSSISDNAKLLGRPENFDFHIREIEIAAGAGFIISIAGSMMRMPGLPSIPAAEGMDIDKDGNITGLS